MRAVWAILVAVVVQAVAVAAGPVPVTWKVVSVHDGDTLTALDADNVQNRVRLHGIDAPEIGQPFGTAARDRLAEVAKGKAVSVTVQGRDRYGRVVADIEIDRHDVGLALVAEGMVWHYERFDNDPRLAAAQREARAAKRGLWAGKAPTPPWEWRASEKDRKRQPAGR